MAASISETCALASPPNSVEAPENNLARELTWAWTSMPITASQSPVEPLISLVFCEGASIAHGRHCSAVRLRVCRAHGKPRLRGQPATTDLPRKQRSARTFRHAERTEQGRTWTSVPLLQNCCAHQLVCALHWKEQIVPVFTAFFSTAQAPGGSFIGLIALANAAGVVKVLVITLAF